ncbi:hypothetical protein [Micromonospora sp. HK10]|uniref:hypothetical protein n=1 Tax=Micromonospora sp. HK10 TaxID=1538294 RepID=UPI000AD32F54|nr:hypothetical protein [Micromonospora sp. HK10]
MLARAQQDFVWDRTPLLLRLRSPLREYYPAMLAAAAGFEDGLASPTVRALLPIPPPPPAWRSSNSATCSSKPAAVVTSPRPRPGCTPSSRAATSASRQ